jgi:hypothetical membrane protein
LSRLRIVSGICGIAAPILVFSLIFLAIGLAPWFNWNRNALSDLGVGATAPIFNSALIVGGLLLLPFSIGLRQILPRGALSLLGTALLSLGMLVLSGIGLFPETAGRIHFYISVAFFTLLPLSVLLIGVSELRQPRSRASGMLTILIGLLAALIWALHWSIRLGGVAVPETISALLGSAWVIAKGAKLVQSSR